MISLTRWHVGSGLVPGCSRGTHTRWNPFSFSACRYVLSVSEKTCRSSVPSRPPCVFSKRSSSASPKLAAK